MSLSPPKQSLHTPVLMVIFNRPETTRQVFEAIREAQPSKLYVAADGPRLGVASDVINCQAARDIIKGVDWDCQVKTLFRDEDMGCGQGPASAFSWFFENEPEGIILEDDCLPSQNFFWFCQELLERYRDDHRVMHIGGNNFLNGWQMDQDYSYYFSKNGYIWGWASWRRAWNKFDYDIKLYQKLKKKEYFKRLFLNPLEKIYRMRKFNKTITSNDVTWWDYQWDFARYVNSGLAIVPKNNMIRNLGFGENATHTHNSNHKNANMIAAEIEFPLTHPPFMIRDFISDRRYFKNFIKDIILSKFS